MWCVAYKWKEDLEIDDPEEDFDIESIVDKKVNVVGQIRRVKTIKTKKGDEMAFITLDCNYELLDVVVFSEVYKEYRSIFDSKKLVLFNGTVREREGNLQLQLLKAKEL